MNFDFIGTVLISEYTNCIAISYSIFSTTCLNMNTHILFTYIFQALFLDIYIYIYINGFVQ